MRVVGSTAVVVVAMMLVVPTAGAPARPLEEVPARHEAVGGRDRVGGRGGPGFCNPKPGHSRAADARTLEEV